MTSVRGFFLEVLRILRDAGVRFAEDRAFLLGGALAFYTCLSLAPLVVFLVWLLGLLGTDAQAQLIEQVRRLIGEAGGEAVRQIVENAENEPTFGSVPGIIGTATLVFGATGVFAQLQMALNVVWQVEAKPGKSVQNWLRKRLLSFGMVFAVAFLLIISLAVSTVLSFLSEHAEGVLPGSGWLVAAGDTVVFALLFAVIYKVLPDVLIGWRDVWTGATITAVLVALGKLLIGLYLGQKSIGSAYGAAGSLVVVLVWVYFSSLVFFYGAEVTQIWARRHGGGLEPDAHARRVPQGLSSVSPK